MFASPGRSLGPRSGASPNNGGGFLHAPSSFRSKLTKNGKKTITIAAGERLPDANSSLKPPVVSPFGVVGTKSSSLRNAASKSRPQPTNSRVAGLINLAESAKKQKRELSTEMRALRNTNVRLFEQLETTSMENQDLRQEIRIMSRSPRTAEEKRYGSNDPLNPHITVAGNQVPAHIPAHNEVLQRSFELEREKIRDENFQRAAQLVHAERDQLERGQMEMDAMSHLSEITGMNQMSPMTILSPRRIDQGFDPNLTPKIDSFVTATESGRIGATTGANRTSILGTTGNPTSPSMVNRAVTPPMQSRSLTPNRLVTSPRDQNTLISSPRGVQNTLISPGRRNRVLNEEHSVMTNVGGEELSVFPTKEEVLDEKFRTLLKDKEDFFVRILKEKEISYQKALDDQNSNMNQIIDTLIQEKSTLKSDLSSFETAMRSYEGENQQLCKERLQSCEHFANAIEALQKAYARLDIGNFRTQVKNRKQALCKFVFSVWKEDTFILSSKRNEEKRKINEEKLGVYHRESLNSALNSVHSQRQSQLDGCLKKSDNRVGNIFLRATFLSWKYLAIIRSVEKNFKMIEKNQMRKIEEKRIIMGRMADQLCLRGVSVGSHPRRVGRREEANQELKNSGESNPHSVLKAISFNMNFDPRLQPYENDLNDNNMINNMIDGEEKRILQISGDDEAEEIKKGNSQLFLMLDDAKQYFPENAAYDGKSMIERLIRDHNRFGCKLKSMSTLGVISTVTTLQKNFSYFLNSFNGWKKYTAKIKRAKTVNYLCLKHSTQLVFYLWKMILAARKRVKAMSEIIGHHTGLEGSPRIRKIEKPKNNFKKEKKEKKEKKGLEKEEHHHHHHHKDKDHHHHKDKDHHHHHGDRDHHHHHHKHKDHHHHHGDRDHHHHHHKDVCSIIKEEKEKKKEEEKEKENEGKKEEKGRKRNQGETRFGNDDDKIDYPVSSGRDGDVSAHQSASTVASRLQSYSENEIQSYLKGHLQSRCTVDQPFDQKSMNDEIAAQRFNKARSPGKRVDDDINEEEKIGDKPRSRSQEQESQESISHRQHLGKVSSLKKAVSSLQDSVSRHSEKSYTLEKRQRKDDHRHKSDRRKKSDKRRQKKNGKLDTDETKWSNNALSESQNRSQKSSERSRRQDTRLKRLTQESIDMRNVHEYLSSEKYQENESCSSGSSLSSYSGSYYSSLSSSRYSSSSSSSTSEEGGFSGSATLAGLAPAKLITKRLTFHIWRQCLSIDKKDEEAKRIEQELETRFSSMKGKLQSVMGIQLEQSATTSLFAKAFNIWKFETETGKLQNQIQKLKFEKLANLSRLRAGLGSDALYLEVFHGWKNLCMAGKELAHKNQIKKNLETISKKHHNALGSMEKSFGIMSYALSSNLMHISFITWHRLCVKNKYDKALKGHGDLKTGLEKVFWKSSNTAFLKSVFHAWCVECKIHKGACQLEQAVGSRLSKLDNHFNRSMDFQTLSRFFGNWKNHTHRMSDVRSLERCGEQVGETLQTVLKNILGFTFSSLSDGGNLEFGRNEFVDSMRRLLSILKYGEAAEEEDGGGPGQGDFRPLGQQYGTQYGTEQRIQQYGQQPRQMNPSIMMMQGSHRGGGISPAVYNQSTGSSYKSPGYVCGQNQAYVRSENEFSPARQQHNDQQMPLSAEKLHLVGNVSLDSPRVNTRVNTRGGMGGVGERITTGMTSPGGGNYRVEMTMTAVDAAGVDLSKNRRKFRADPSTAFKNTMNMEANLELTSSEEGDERSPSPGGGVGGSQGHPLLDNSPWNRNRSPRNRSPEQFRKTFRGEYINKIEEQKQKFEEKKTRALQKVNKSRVVIHSNGIIYDDHTKGFKFSDEELRLRDFQYNLLKSSKAFEAIIRKRLLAPAYDYLEFQYSVQKMFHLWRNQVFESKLEMLRSKAKVVEKKAANTTQYFILKILTGKVSENISFYFQKWREFTRVSKIESAEENYNQLFQKYLSACSNFSFKALMQNDSVNVGEAFAAWKDLWKETKIEEKLEKEIEKQQLLFEQAQKFALTCALFGDSNPRIILGLAFNSWHKIAVSNKYGKELERIRENFKLKSHGRSLLMMEGHKYECHLVSSCFFHWKLLLQAYHFDLERARLSASTEDSLHAHYQPKIQNFKTKRFGMINMIEKEIKDREEYISINHHFALWRIRIHEAKFSSLEQQNKKIWKRAIKSFEILNNQSVEFFTNEIFCAWRNFVQDKQALEKKEELEAQMFYYANQSGCQKLRIAFATDDKSIMRIWFSTWREIHIATLQDRDIEALQEKMIKAQTTASIHKLQAVFGTPLTKDFLKRECFDAWLDYMDIVKQENEIQAMKMQVEFLRQDKALWKLREKFATSLGSPEALLTSTFASWVDLISKRKSDELIAQKENIIALAHNNFAIQKLRTMFLTDDRNLMHFVFDSWANLYKNEVADRKFEEIMSRSQKTKKKHGNVLSITDSFMDKHAKEKLFLTIFLSWKHIAVHENRERRLFNYEMHLNKQKTLSEKRKNHVLKLQWSNKVENIKHDVWRLWKDVVKKEVHDRSVNKLKVERDTLFGKIQQHSHNMFKKHYQENSLRDVFQIWTKVVSDGKQERESQVWGMKLQEHLSDSAVQKLRTAFGQDERSMKITFFQAWGNRLNDLRFEKRLEHHVTIIKSKEKQTEQYLSSIGRKFLTYDINHLLVDIFTEWRIHALHHCKNDRKIEELEKKICNLHGDRAKHLEKLKTQFHIQDKKSVKIIYWNMWRNYTNENRWSKHLDQWQKDFMSQKQHMEVIHENMGSYMMRKKHELNLQHKVFRYWHSLGIILKKHRKERKMGIHLGIRMVQHGDHIDTMIYLMGWKQWTAEQKKNKILGRGQICTAKVQEIERHNFLLHKTWDAWMKYYHKHRMNGKFLHSYLNRVDTFHKMQFWFLVWSKYGAVSRINEYKSKDLRHHLSLNKIGMAFANSHETLGLKKILTTWNLGYHHRKHLKIGLVHLAEKHKLRCESRFFQQWKYLLLKHAVSEIQYRHHVDRSDLAGICFSFVDRRADLNLMEKMFHRWFESCRHDQFDRHSKDSRTALVDKHYRVSDSWIHQSYLLEVFHSWAWHMRRKLHVSKEFKSHQKAEKIVSLLTGREDCRIVFHHWYKQISVRSQRIHAVIRGKMKHKDYSLKKSIIHEWKAVNLHSYIKRNYGYGVIKHTTDEKNRMRLVLSNWFTLVKLNGRYRNLTRRFDNLISRLDKHLATSQYSTTMLPILKAWYVVAGRSRMLREHNYIRRRQTLCAYFSVWHGVARQESARQSLHKIHGDFHSRVKRRDFSLNNLQSRIHDRFSPPRSPSPILNRSIFGIPTGPDSSKRQNRREARSKSPSKWLNTNSNRNGFSTRNTEGGKSTDTDQYHGGKFKHDGERFRFVNESESSDSFYWK